jgi:hypothetical protein
MTPRSICTLEQLRADIANIATTLDSGEMALWVRALDEVLREVGGDPHRDDCDGAWDRLATVAVEEGEGAPDETAGTSGCAPGSAPQVTTGGEPEVGPGAGAEAGSALQYWAVEVENQWGRQTYRCGGDLIRPGTATAQARWPDGTTGIVLFYAKIRRGSVDDMGHQDHFTTHDLLVDVDVHGTLAAIDLRLLRLSSWSYIEEPS